MDPKLMRMYSDMLNEAPAQQPAQQPPQTQPSLGGIWNAIKGTFANAGRSNVNPTGPDGKPTAPGPGVALASPGGKTNPGPVSTVKPAPVSGSNLPAKKPPAKKPPAKPAPVQSQQPAQTAPGGGPTNAAQLAAAQGKEPAAPAGAGGGSGSGYFGSGAGVGAATNDPDTRSSTARGVASNLTITGGPTADAPASQAAVANASGTGLGAQTDAFGPVTQVAQPQTATTNPTGTGSGGGGVVGTKLAGDTNIGTRDYSKADMSPGNYMRQATTAFQEESELAEDELSEEQLEEAFNDMLRLSGLEKKNLEESKLVNEKAVSKQQQKFMGMVHAMQKGEKVKGASPELKKAAKSMGKKDARDFAATKHKGLPQKVNEGIHLMLDEDGHTLEHIVNRYKHEVRRFIEGDFMPENLYDALYDYYMDRGDMPYGVAKAREGDPYQWVSERFYDDVMRDLGNGMNETVQPVMDNTLNELAQLAGLAPAAKDISLGNIARKSGEFVGQIEKGASDTAGAIKRGMSDIASNFQAGREAGKKPEFGPAFTKGVDPSLRTTPDAKMSPKPMPRELPSPGLGSLPSPKVGYGARGPGSENPLRESEINECGDMGMDQRDTINVSTNMSSDGNKSVNISAQGEKAEELLAMLKLAGMGDKPRFNTDDGVDLDHPGAIEIHGTMDADGAEQLAKQLRHASMSEQEMMDEAKKTRTTKYKNTPDEEYQSVASITRQGNDLNREKRQYADKPKLGDNPMAESFSLEEQFETLYNSILVKEADPNRPKGDTGIADIFTAGKGIPPPSPDEGPVGKAATTPTQSPTTGKPAQSGLAGFKSAQGAGPAAPTGTGASGFPVQGTQTSRQSALAGFKSAQGAKGPAAPTGTGASPTPKTTTQSALNIRIPGATQAAPAPGTKR